MARFERGTQLPVPPGASYSLHKAWETRYQRWVLLKSHRCDTHESVNQLLKTALYFQQCKSFALPLLPPFLAAEREHFPPFLLTFIWELSKSDYKSEATTWEEIWPQGKSAFSNKVTRYSSQQRCPAVKVTEAYAELQSMDVIVKTYSCSEAREMNAALYEAFIHARMHHTNICRLFDLYVYASKHRTTKICLVLERLEGDFLREVEERANSHRLYYEEDLWSLMEQAAQGLLHAKRLVMAT